MGVRTRVDELREEAKDLSDQLRHKLKHAAFLSS